MNKKIWDIEETLGLILLAIAFILIEGVKNKLILGGIFFIYLGLMELLDMKRDSNIKNIALYGACIFLFLGLFAFGIAYLLPNFPNLFAILFGIIIFLEFILLFIFGYKGWFKNILFILFSLPFIWAVYSLFITFFSVGINELKIPELAIAILAFLTLILIYWAFLSFFHKILPKNRVTSFLISKKGFVDLLILLILLIIVGFLGGGLQSIFHILETINKFPQSVFSILGILGFFSLINKFIP